LRVEAQAAFNLFDQNGTGGLDKSEFQLMLNVICAKRKLAPPGWQETLEIFNTLAPGLGSQEVPFDSFFNWWRRIV